MKRFVLTTVVVSLLIAPLLMGCESQKLKDENMKLKQQVDAVTQQKNALQTKFDELNKSKEELTQKVSDLEKKNQELTAQLEAKSKPKAAPKTGAKKK